MFFLLATILLNVIIVCIFKLYPRFKIDTLQAIVVNYATCVVTGSLFVGHMPFSAAAVQQSWFPWALLMGGSFISIFYLIAICTKIDGITTTTVANKLSLVIPAVCAVVLYHDRMTVAKIAGIAIAFPAVYLTTRVPDNRHKSQNLLLPILLFIGSGLLDTLMKYVECYFLASPGVQAVFAIYCFAAAGVLGVAAVSLFAITGKTTLHWRNLIAGICLGIPNYFSIYYFIRLLHSGFLQSSAAIPINNIGILVASALAAMFFFRERPTVWRLVGLALSVAAIALIAYGDMCR
jgi:drug/metabolite transporter (DMT)-like permease